MNAPAPTTGAGHPTRWAALAVLVLPVLLTSMDLSVLYLAIPLISADLAPSSSQMLWILDIYGFVLAGLLITMGNLGDRFGRRLVLLTGATLFGAASVLAAFSTSPEMLIAARALMGLGGATLMPSTLSLIRNMFVDSGERTKAIGVWTAAFAGGGALGPVVGGALLNFFSWGWVFLINVPVLVVLLVAAPVLVPEHRDRSQARFDLVGAALSMAAILPLVYAVKHAAEIAGWDSRCTIAAAAGAAAAILFVLRQRIAVAPLVDTTLFRSRRFVGALVAVTLGIMALLGPNMYLARYLQLVVGLSPLTAALWMVPMTVAAMTGSMLAPQLAARVGTARAVAAGFSTAAVGLAIISLTPPADGLAVVVIGGIVLSGGVVSVMTLATDAVVAAATPERAGAASAIQETGSEFGGALGVALMGSLGVAIYRANLELPPEAPAVARESLASARAAAEDLPEDLRTSVLADAADAFTAGLSVAAVAGAVAMAALAVLVPWLMRGSDPDRDLPEPDPHHTTDGEPAPTLGDAEQSKEARA
ncbi:MFS transporter [Nocardia sp. CNY236]|uniref:MFS transporter n=1 Tax=Nocardia sp. CNY236 TaxID=1169152 RepID=UPI00040B4373|nr:MFS transporter [Nocardia sp. CNY236]